MLNVLPLSSCWLTHRQVIIASKVHGGMFSTDLDRAFIVNNRSDPPTANTIQPKVGGGR